jgi:hypothetical protein
MRSAANHTSHPCREKASSSTRPSFGDWKAAVGIQLPGAAGNVRQVRPDLQHQAPEPGIARAHHPTAVVERRARCRSAPAASDPGSSRAAWARAGSLAPAFQARVQPLVDDGTEALDRNATTVLDTEIQLATIASGKIGGTVRHPAGTGARKLQVYSNNVVKIGSIMFSLTQPTSGRVVIAEYA